jgi:hypothetical protein
MLIHQKQRLLSSVPKKPLYNVLIDKGLLPGLKLCLDAGDALSYTSGQKWLDRTQGGYDFFRGADVTATTDDPTFTGNSGTLDQSTYWSFDGGDYFTYDSATESWMNNLHKAGAKFSIALLYYVPALTGFRWLLGEYLNDNAKIGVQIVIVNGDAVRFSVANGSGVAAFSADSTWLTSVGWHLSIVSVDEANAFGLWYDNGRKSTFASTYTTPSASASTHIMQIGATGSNGSPLPSGFRIAAVAIWEGRTLGLGDCEGLYRALKKRVL